MKNNKRGSTLVYAIIVILILNIVMAGMATIAFSYYRKSIRVNSQRQSYLSSKAIVTNITEKIIQGDNEYMAIIPNVENESSTKINVSNFPSLLGKVSDADMYVISETVDNVKTYILTISVEVHYNEQSTRLNADLSRKEGASKWQLLKYYEGKKPQNINVVRAENMLSMIDDIRKFLDGTKCDVDDCSKISLDERKKLVVDYMRKLDPAAVSLIETALGKKLDHTSIRDAIIRDFFYYSTLLNNSWPLFDNNASSVKLPNTTYYIQFHFNSNAFTDVDNKHDILIFASTSNKSSGNWPNVNLFYINNRWWYNSKSSISVPGITGGEDNWKEKMDKWLEGAVPIT